MQPFENITNRILEKLKSEGITRFSIENIKYIISERNFLLDLFEIDWINWEMLDNNDNNEIDFRKDMYDSLKDACKETGLKVSYDEFDKIFRYERDIVPHYKIDYYEDKFIMIDENREVPFTEMVFKKKFKINKWLNWKKTIDKAIGDYYEEFEILPNVLFANKHTLSQFNFLINSIPGEKEDVFRYDEDIMMKLPIDEEEEIILSGYESGDCRLYFWFDETMKDKIFILDYNDDLNWDDDDDDDDNDDDEPILPPPTPKRSLVKV